MIQKYFETNIDAIALLFPFGIIYLLILNYFSGMIWTVLDTVGWFLEEYNLNQLLIFSLIVSSNVKKT